MAQRHRLPLPIGSEAPLWSELPIEQRVLLEEVRTYDEKVGWSKGTCRKHQRIYEPDWYCQAAVVSRLDYSRAQPCGKSLASVWTDSYKLLYKSPRCEDHETPAQQEERHQVQTAEYERQRLANEQRRLARALRRSAKEQGVTKQKRIASWPLTEYYAEIYMMRVLTTVRNTLMPLTTPHRTIAKSSEETDAQWGWDSGVIAA